MPALSQRLLLTELDGTASKLPWGLRPIQLVLLIAAADLLVLLVMFVIANLRAVRLKKGELWQFTLQEDNVAGGLYAKRTAPPKKIGWGWRMMLAPVNESANVGDAAFAAVPFPRRGLGFHRVHPTVTVRGVPDEPQSYFVSSVAGQTQNLLREIRCGRTVRLQDGLRPITATGFFHSSIKVADVPENGTETFRLRDDTAMIYRPEPDGSYTVWVYALRA